MTKKYKALDVDGMPPSDQKNLIPKLPKKKYQITIKSVNGSTRYIYADNPKVVEAYAKVANVTILKVTKL